MSKRILELARVRTETLTIAGDAIIVREPSALENIEYRQRRLKDMSDAIAYLISECVTDQEGARSWTFEEAQVIARGRMEVWSPIVAAITGFLTREKKVDSLPPSDSTTA